MRQLFICGSLLLFVLAASPEARAQSGACEHRGATSVFELAITSSLLATAAVARPSDGPAILIALEWHRGAGPRGARIDLLHDDPALVDGERVLVFVQRRGEQLLAPAGSRALLRGADLGLAPELALYAELPRGEREELAVALARRSLRCASDRAAALAQLQPALVAEPARSERARSFLGSLRARRARQG
ncbi:MAG: hypothetical protein IPN34_04195 [Planctomycetes bacterium]|nr:hypothetical protein [Planctomycetota bacterium]